METPVFAPLRSQGTNRVDTDAFDKQMGCLLLYNQPEWIQKPVGYLACLLNDKECAYDTTRHERLAVV